jgi:hypothetical protein
MNPDEIQKALVLTAMSGEIIGSIQTGTDNIKKLLDDSTKGLTRKQENIDICALADSITNEYALMYIKACQMRKNAYKAMGKEVT